MSEKERGQGFWGRRSLRMKFTAFAILVGLVPLILIGLYSFSSSRRAIDESVKNQVHNQAEKITEELQDYFRESRVTLLTISSSPAWLKFYTDPDNKETWRQEQQRVINYIDDAANIGIEEFCYIGSNGKENTRLVLGDLDHDLSEDEASNPFFKPSFELEAGEVFQSKPYTSPDTGNWVFATTTPIIGENGEKLAFLHLERNLDQIQAILKRGARGTGEDAMILDEQNNVIVSSKTSVDHKANKLEVKKSGAAFEAGHSSAEEESHEDSGMESGMNVGVATFDDRGKGYYVIAEMLKLDELNQNKWHVLLSVPRSAEAQYTSSFSLLPVLAIIVLGLIVGSALLVARFLTKPISELVIATDKVAHGDLDVTIKNKGGDEFGVLAKGFNQMTNNLRQMINSEKDAKNYLKETVEQYKHFVENVSNGDLTARLSLNGGNDDLSTLGRNLNHMVESLNTMANNISEATDDLASASSEIFSASAHHNSGASEQAAAITQTTATIDEVRQTAQQTTESAQTVADSSRKSAEMSKSGTAAVDETITGMNQIKNQVEQIAENIRSLSAQTHQIGDIITSVNDIAEQSNLLALNASIEAARAGESGRGFAVVASEVRRLAEQSQLATSRVREILDSIQKATNTVVMATEEGTKGVDSGVKLANKSGDAIRFMAETVALSSDATSQIVASAKQQSHGMDQITSAMNDINQSTTQTLASTRQTEEAAKNLGKLGERLKNAIAIYKIKKN